MVKRIAVAMSGGVDSSAAALLLMRQGFEVAGFHMRLFSGLSGFGPVAGGGSEPAETAARSVCDALGIPFFGVDLGETFRSRVVEPFVDVYLGGETPNPCVTCNREIKFGALLEAAKRLGYEKIATGHYARIVKDGVETQLIRGADCKKDQSYFLYSIGIAALESSVFPNGELTKDEIRRIAAEEGLPTTSRSESQEICFAGGDSYIRLIEEMRPGTSVPGIIVDKKGIEIGRHRGIAHYTIGQRRWLNISAPEPLYVVDIDAAQNIIVAGYRGELYAEGLYFRDATFLTQPPKKGEAIEIKIRFNAASVRAVYEGIVEKTSEIYRGGELHGVRFEEPQRAISPGQSAVIYNGDRVVGGGIICTKI